MLAAFVMVARAVSSKFEWNEVLLLDSYFSEYTDIVSHY